MTTCINRGSAEDRDCWLAELEITEVAKNFPSGGSLILAESSTHALKIAQGMATKGLRTIVRGVYVRTTIEMPEKY